MGRCQAGSQCQRDAAHVARVCGRTRDADMAVIYYAGHGIELEGTNYLIPTDATLETDGDVLDETIALDRALFAVEPAKQLRLDHPGRLPRQSVLPRP